MITEETDFFACYAQPSAFDILKARKIWPNDRSIHNYLFDPNFNIIVIEIFEI